MNERGGEVEGLEKKGRGGRQFVGGVIQRMQGTASLPPSSSPLPHSSSGWKFILQAEQRTFVWSSSGGRDVFSQQQQQQQPLSPGRGSVPGWTEL